MVYKNEFMWFVDVEFIVVLEKDKVVFVSGEYLGWYRFFLGLKSVYCVVVLLNLGVFLVVDYIEIIVLESLICYVSVFFYNRYNFFVLKKDKYGEMFVFIMFEGYFYYVLCFNGYQEYSEV